MATFPVNKIRNVCIMGHGSDGKTSLVESLLFTAGMTDRVGKVPEGNTVCDFDPEEVKRQFSISTAVAPVVWNHECKINLLDTPGFFDFENEVNQALRVAESALIVATGKAGPGVGTEKAWKRVLERKCRVCSIFLKLMRKIPIIIPHYINYKSNSVFRFVQSSYRFLRAIAIPWVS